MVRLPAQNKTYNPAFKIIALLPAVIMIAVIGVAVTFGWSYLHGSGGVPSDAAVPAGTMGADALQSRMEGTLLYPGATNVSRVSGPLSSSMGQNSAAAGVVPPLLASAGALASMPVVATTLSSTDSADKVLAWYKNQLEGRGWCAPGSLNQTGNVQFYARQRREAFSIITLQTAQSGSSSPSLLLTYYALFPDSSVVPSC